MQSRTEYVVDTTRSSLENRDETIRLLIGLLDEEAAKYECDLPFSRQADWPLEVREAASLLASLRAPKSQENAHYRQTGVHERSDAEVWGAFVTFAPYAFDASVWDPAGHQVLSLADEGTSVVARLTDAEAEVLSRSRRVPVVKLKNWQRAKRT